MTRWVENYWMLRWSLPGDVSYSSQILPHPACSLTLEQGGQPRPEVAATGTQVVVTGVVTSRFDVDIRGRGWVFGVKFRPGGLVALTGVGPARAWADRTLPAAGIVPDDVAQHWPVSTPTVTRAGGSRRRRPRWAAYLIAWTPAMVRCSRSSRTCSLIGSS